MQLATSISRKIAPRYLGVALLCLLPVLAMPEDDTADQTFARYARYGADVWARNPLALISGEGEACISCHTSLPYALVEPLLPDDYAAYDDMLKNIDSRILTWNDNTAWYADEKLEETAAVGGLPPDALKGFLNGPDSRGVESVFNALISAVSDAYAGNAATRETKQAFENMWEEQIKTGPAAGRWGWIKANLIPWEAADSDIWGAALACVAASLYPDLAPQDDLQLLNRSLGQAVSNPEVSLHSKLAVTWCDAESGGQVLETGVAANVAAELMALQRADGGWSLRDLGPWTGWEDSDSDCCSKRDVRTDAYATGFVTLTLVRNLHHLPADEKDRLASAIDWIDAQLANPYPAGPRYNTHNTTAAELPEFRDNLYANAGAMWSYLAKTVYDAGKAPWNASP